MHLATSPRTLALAGAICVIIWLLKSLYRGLRGPLRSVPGPWHTAFIPIELKVATMTGRRIFHIHDMHERYGPVVRIGPNEVSVSDPEGFKKIHSISSGFVKDAWYHRLTDLPRHVTFTMQDHKAHAQRRRLLARGFSKTYLRTHWEPTVRRVCETAVQRICEEAKSGLVDVHKWWTFMAQDALGELAFGESFGLLEMGQKPRYIRVLEAGFVGNGIGAELPLLRRLFAHVPYRPLQDAFDPNPYILGYAQRAVEAAKTHGEQSCLMATMIAEAEQSNTSIDAMDVKSESTSLMFAGSGTTANLMTYFIWCVASRPDLQQALEDEVAGLSGEEIKDERLESLPLLNATLKETLRLYGSAPGSLPRVVPDGGVTIAGHYLPKGVICGTQAYTLHRDPESWKSPLEFDPGRHLSPALEAVPPEQAERAKTTYSAWGAGAYTCIGQHLAGMEMRFAAFYFLKNCRGAKLSLTADKDMEMENFFVVTPKGGKCEILLP